MACFKKFISDFNPPEPQAMPMKELPLAKAFMLIEPGPVTLVTTTVGRKKNIMTISWTLVMDVTPKLAFVTGASNHSFHALMDTRECVIAIPSVDMLETVVGIGTCLGADTDKFRKFGLNPVKAKAVKSPLIAECIANIESHEERRLRNKFPESADSERRVRSFVPWR